MACRGSSDSSEPLQCNPPLGAERRPVELRYKRSHSGIFLGGQGQPSGRDGRLGPEESSGRARSTPCRSKHGCHFKVRRPGRSPRVNHLRGGAPVQPVRCCSLSSVVEACPALRVPVSAGRIFFRPHSLHAVQPGAWPSL
ncbi:hypothetical protein NDU88_008149 [Pleurodeles waltl]|uniref:Uncharacterized protein n=1 Tax=Pleurodeles waltl TaxID=8319 RepID=A0AAV7PSB9_PLEWA|nr:hypothetical protein NDU88_008149 [Pleurodeles waltl]